MKRTSSLPRLLALATLALLPASALAQTTRNNAQVLTGTYDWSNTNNWRNGATPPPQSVPNGGNFTAFINADANSEIGAGQVVTYNLTSNVTLGSLLMGGTGSTTGRSFTVTGTGGSLTMNNTIGTGLANIQANGDAGQEALIVSADVSLVDPDGTLFTLNTAAAINGSVSGSSALSKVGSNAATLYLGGSNSYTGNLSVINGTVIATNTAAFSASSASISFDGNTANGTGIGTRATGTTTVASALTFGNGTFTNQLTHGGSDSTLDLTSSSINMGTGNGTINLSRFDGTNNAAFGLPSVTGNGTVRFSGTGFTVNRNVAVNANTSLVLNPSSGVQTWNGNITGSGVSIEKTGAGTAVINNTAGNFNTFSGALIVSDGVLQLGQSVAANRGLSSVSSVTVNSGGILEFGRDAWAGSAPVTLNGTIRGFASGQTYQSFGPLTMNGGTLQLTNGTSAAFRQAALGGNVTVAGTTASTINSTGTTNLGLHLASNLGGVNRVFTVNDVTSSSAVDLTVSAALLDSSNSAGNASLTKAGAGTMRITAVNTYNGTTTVNAGTLLVDGSIGAGAVAVNSGATLGGSGTVNGAVSVNAGGTLAPGSSPGILTVNNSLSVVEGAISFELNGATAGTGYDQVLLTGASAALTLTGTTNLQLTLGFTPTLNSLYFLVNNTGSSTAISGAFTQLNGVATTLTQGSSFFLGGQEFLISYTGDSAGNTFTGGNDLTLQAVPEPTTWALIGLGLGVLLLARRRQA